MELESKTTTPRGQDYLYPGTLDQDFSPLSLLTFGAGQFFPVGSCTIHSIKCLAMSLTLTHRTPELPIHPPSAGTLPSLPLGAKLTLVANHCWRHKECISCYQEILKYQF